MGMLDSDQSGSKIEPTKLEKGLTAIQKLKSLAAVAKFDTGRKDARDWGVQLESRVKELKALGASQAEEMDRSIQADLAKAIEALPLTYGPMQNEKSSALKKCRAFLPHS